MRLMDLDIGRVGLDGLPDRVAREMLGEFGPAGKAMTAQWIERMRHIRLFCIEIDDLIEPVLANAIDKGEEDFARA